MLGTNNRTTADNATFSYTKQSFYDELQIIKNRLELNGTEIIFMSAPPAGSTNESQSGIHFHMNDVDDVIAKFAADNNMEYLRRAASQRQTAQADVRLDCGGDRVEQGAQSCD